MDGLGSVPGIEVQQAQDNSCFGCFDCSETSKTAFIAIGIIFTVCCFIAFPVIDAIVTAGSAILSTLGLRWITSSEDSYASRLRHLFCGYLDSSPSHATRLDTRAVRRGTYTRASTYRRSSLPSPPSLTMFDTNTNLGLHNQGRVHSPHAQRGGPPLRTVRWSPSTNSQGVPAAYTAERAPVYRERGSTSGERPTVVNQWEALQVGFQTRQRRFGRTTTARPAVTAPYGEAVPSSRPGRETVRSVVATPHGEAVPSSRPGRETVRSAVATPHGGSAFRENSAA